MYMSKSYDHAAFSFVQCSVNILYDKRGTDNTMGTQ